MLSFRLLRSLTTAQSTTDHHKLLYHFKPKNAGFIADITAALLLHIVPQHLTRFSYLLGGLPGGKGLNTNFTFSIDLKTNHRSEYILVVQPPNSKKNPSSFGSNCGIYSCFILVDASNNRCRWRRDLAKEAFYAQSRVNMRRFACC